jgi:hypothetical protein
MLLGALMGVVAFTVYAWLDRNTSYWIGGAGRDHMFEWMAFAAIVGAVYGGLFGFFIGCVIGIIEMPRFGAVLAGVTAGVLGATWIFASGGSTEDFWGVLGILAIPAGAVIGFCSGGWANRQPGPRLTAAEDEAKSGSIFKLDDHLPVDTAISEKRH